MKRWLAIEKRALGRGFGLILVLLALVAVPTMASALSQGYKTSETLTPGTLVGLDASADGAIRSSNTDREGELIGVVVAADSTSLSLTGASTNVQVVTNGTASALVSTINGDIKKGDAIAVSPINGVGMKATAAGRVLGLAQNDFSASSSGATTQSIDTKTSKEQVALGSVQVSIAVGYYTPPSAKTFVPQSVQSYVNNLVGKNVSPYRIVTSAALLLLGLALVIIILNSAIRSSMESIGRNPLAKGAVNAGLYKIIFLSILVLLVTLASVYFVIKG